MPHISKKQRKNGVAPVVVAYYLETMTGLKGKRGYSFLESFLTETERIMLAKRLATIHMLMEKCSYYHIGKTLGVSTSTTKRIHEELLIGTLSPVVRVISKKEQREELNRLIEKISRGGLPIYGARWHRRKRPPGHNRQNTH